MRQTESGRRRPGRAPSGPLRAKDVIQDDSKDLEDLDLGLLDRDPKPFLGPHS